MAENILFSFITTMYNEEKHLEKSVASVLSQTYPHWELIIVDDGSTDKSPAMAAEYAKNDPRIHYIRQEHKGTCSAGRNTAMPYVHGEYIQILDADDWIDNDMLEKYALKLSEHPYDVIVPIERFINDDGQISLSKCEGFENIVLSGEQAFYVSIDWTIHGHCCSRSSIAKNLGWNNEFFNGDEFTYREIFFTAKEVAFANTSYYYRQNPFSITKSRDNEYRMYQFLLSYFKLYTYTIEKEMPEEIRTASAKALLRMLIDHSISYRIYKNTYTPNQQQEIEQLHNNVVDDLSKILGSSDILI